MKRAARNGRACAALALALALWLGGCASTGRAPVEDLSLGGGGRAPSGARAAPVHPATTSASYRVQRGDTLYSIAFRHGIDYRELASWNHIGAPYTIYVGQELRVAVGMRANAPVASARAQPPRPPAPPARTAIPGPAAQPAKPAPFETVSTHAASTGAPAAPVASPSSGTGTVAAAASAGAVASAPVAASPPASVTPGEIAWRWPGAGTVVGSYVAGDPTRQGIDIAGKSGDPVRAAADGTIVYSGNGLIGYGELIIIKHSPAFLSAYGHNRKRLVKEGDHVSAGQLIAEMGSSSASRDSLHFEIRKNGKPANPADYLPRR